MTCPICDKKTDARYRPFCSRRCADVDLGKWLNGSYAIPSDDPDEDQAPPPDNAAEADDFKLH